jgi:hypothetical protein
LIYDTEVGKCPDQANQKWQVRVKPGGGWLRDSPNKYTRLCGYDKPLDQLF